MGPQEDYIETVFTCEGDFDDPELHARLEEFRKGLKTLLSTDKQKLILKKVEPWNSVRVTFNIPREAALKLKQLAQQGNSSLRQMGVLAVQIQGDQLISLTITNKNNERTELVFKATDSHSERMSAAPIPDNISLSSQSNVEMPCKNRNIAEYLRQSNTFIDSLFQQGSECDLFRSPSVVASTSNSIPFHVTANSSHLPRDFTVTNTSCSTETHKPVKPLTLPQPHIQLSPGSSPIGQPGIKFPSPTGMPLQNPNPITAMHGTFPFLGYPPPPPYPQGSSLINNIPKTSRGTTVTSPLLVNLLQNEPTSGLISQLMNDRMFSNPEEAHPSRKVRKRRPRKPKEPSSKNKAEKLDDAEISIHSIPNPALNSGVSQSDRTEPILSGVPSTQPLPATDNVKGTVVSNKTTCSSLPSSSVMPSLNQRTLPSSSACDQILSYSLSDSAIHNSFPFQATSLPGGKNDNLQFLPENTAGKIINPYTGQLEPMENLSDTSPTKSDSSKDVKTVEQTDSKDVLKSPEHNIPILKEPLPYIFNPANQMVNPPLSLGQNVKDEGVKQHSHLHDNFFSKHEQRAQVSNLTSCANKISDFKNEEKTFSRSNSRSKSPRSFGIELENNQPNRTHFDMLKENIFSEAGTPNLKSSRLNMKTPPLHNNIFHPQNKSRLVEREQFKTQVSQYEVHSQESDVKKESFNLHSATLKTAETHSGNVIESPESKASDQDSENSSLSSLIHDTATDHLHLTPTSKLLNHDSGIGSNSDDTPSEPGDTDFKGNQKIMKAISMDCVSTESVQRHPASKCDSKVITVGYAFAGNNPVSVNHKIGPEVPTMLSVDKYRTTDTSATVNCVMGLEKNPNPVTILHWSMKDGLPSNPKSCDSSSHKQETRSGRNSPRVNQRLTPPSFKENKASSPNTSSVYGNTPSSQCNFSSTGYPSGSRTLTQHATTYSFNQKDMFSSPPKSHDCVSLQIGDNSPVIGNPRLGIPVQPARQQSPSVSASQQMAPLNISSSLMSVSSSIQSAQLSNIAQRNPISSSVASDCAKHNNRSNSPRATVPSSFSSSHGTDTIGASLSKSSVCLANTENSKGSNITSIYSKTPKRSTPTSASSSSVFVSELPLPKRLTESIQKLVKPLGDTSTPHFRKSPVSSSGKQTSVNSPPRISAVSSKNLSPKTSDNSPQSSTSASFPDSTYCDNIKSLCADVSSLSCVSPSATVPSTPPITVVSSLSQDTVVTSCLSVLSSPSCDYLKQISEGSKFTRTVSSEIHKDAQKEISLHTVNSATYNNSLMSDYVNSHTQSSSAQSSANDVINKCKTSERSGYCYNVWESSSHTTLTDDTCLNKVTAQPLVSKNIPSPSKHGTHSPSFPDVCPELNAQSSHCSIIDSTTSEINDQRQDCVYSQNSNTEKTCDSNSASSVELSDANKGTLSLDHSDHAQSPGTENNLSTSENSPSANMSPDSVGKQVIGNTVENFLDDKTISSCDIESKFINNKSSHVQSEGNIDDCDSLTSDICDSSGSVVSRDDINDPQTINQLCPENLHKDIINSLDTYNPSKTDNNTCDSVSHRTLRTRSRGNSGGDNNEDETVTDVNKHLRIVTRRRKNSDSEFGEEILNKKSKLDVECDELNSIVLNCVDKVETHKNDLSHLDSNDLENLQSSDIVRRSARVRAQHTDEKVKKVPSDIKRDKLNVEKLQSSFDEDGKKGCRRPKFPIDPLAITTNLEDKAQIKGRMRSAVADLKEEVTDLAKRSTRLTKTKESTDSVQIKRRRSSRDHR